MAHKQIRLPENTQKTFHYRANFVRKMRYSTGDSYLSLFLSYSESIGCITEKSSVHFYLKVAVIYQRINKSCGPDLISNLDRALNRGHRQTDVIIMDFAKAFDKVPHRRLLYKLHYYGIRGSTHQWIASWLSERFQKVVLDGQASDPVPVLSGVPQGSVLGPVLFLIFINDLPNNIRSSVRLFADDCVLYGNIKTLTDCQILQDDLNSLGQWETDWQMKFNVAKCHSMRVTRHLPS